MDRYDELMFGLYRGVTPDWIPEARRAMFVRESVRRRCALGQTLVANWRCTMFFARSVVSEDVALEVFAAWPAHRASAANVTTALYLGLDQVLRGAAGTGALWELFQYESLVVNDLLCAPEIRRVPVDRVRALGLGDREVYGFGHDVQALHTHMTLYASAAAPARFARDYQVRDRPTYVARARPRDQWLLEDVTGAVEG